MSEIGHNGKLSEFEEQKIKNEFSFQLLNRTHVLERALEHLVKGKIGKAHAWILRSLARSLDASEGGVVIIDRDEVCTDLGISRDTLRKRIYELRSMGYIKGENVENGRSRSHFVLGDCAIDHERIMSDYVAAIAQFCTDERAKREPIKAFETVPNSGNDRTQSRDKPYLKPGMTVPKTGNGRTQSREPEDATPSYEDIYINPPLTPPHGSEPAPVVPTKPKSEPRGTRLAADWVLPKSWGEWALDHYDASPEQIRREAASFRDYWVAAPGSRGRKCDWPATWRSWIRKKDWRVRKIETEVAPDLIATKRQTIVSAYLDEDGNPIA